MIDLNLRGIHLYHNLPHGMVVLSFWCGCTATHYEGALTTTIMPYCAKQHPFCLGGLVR